ncbi:PREDICTED: probable E3 ubiquitin protein ligase DRIPH [Camelina sativa]|uniref:Probable E3 ubiquitin protein ligase DRIPH n=2 Tax=Camelina sativa TaxID=90675 RepID=A0ABM0T600_CAMSA|nr:PREDICTED: probable E3 ubiquitin protein ligase DRIPH [Camelina sativa]
MPTVRVKKEDVARCFTCPLCTKRFVGATTIIECLHTFCWDCIHDKFTTQKLRACPVCNVDLGGLPLEKLRKDYGWIELRQKIFPLKTKGVKAEPKTVATSLKSSKKKKKPLTSPLESSSRVPFSPAAPLEPNVVVEENHRHVVLGLFCQSAAKPIITFKKRGRKASVPKKNDSGMVSEQPNVKKLHPFDLNNEPDNGLDEAEASRSQDCIPNINDAVVPLNMNDAASVIVELANGVDCVVNRETKEVPVQENHQNTVLIKSDRDTEEVSGQKLMNNSRGKQGCGRSRSRKEKGKQPVGNGYGSRLRPRKDGRTVPPAAVSTPEVAIPVEGEKEVERRDSPVFKPVWFKLVASTTHNNEMILPDIKSPYIRVKNGNMTVSNVKKYLMVKIGGVFENEDEVEIWLGHEPLSSSLTLQNVIDWWVQITPLPKRQSAMVGDSAADFVMVLHYSFKSECSASGSGSGSGSE